MKFLRFQILASLLLCLLIEAKAQTTIYYRYDNAGNRKYRGLNISIVDGGRKAIKEDEDTTIIMKQVVNIYPNPTTDIFYIEPISSETIDFEKSNFQLIDIKGVVMMSGKLNAKTEIDLSSKPIGVYFVRVWINEKLQVWKVVKN